MRLFENWARFCHLFCTFLDFRILNGFFFDAQTSFQRGFGAALSVIVYGKFGDARSKVGGSPWVSLNQISEVLSTCLRDDDSVWAGGL